LKTLAAAANHPPLFPVYVFGTGFSPSNSLMKNIPVKRILEGSPIFLRHPARANGLSGKWFFIVGPEVRRVGDRGGTRNRHSIYGNI
jgi:hypothetical protein